jgi:peptidyl-prolyl cis-trans isomerase C
MRPSVPVKIALTVALLAAPVVFAAEPTKKPASPAKAAPAAPAKAKAPAAPESSLPEVVAVVEGEEIKKAELQKAFDAVLAAQGIPAATLPEAQKLEGYRMILEDMVLEKLVQKRAAGIEVADAEVTAMVDKIKANFGSEEELQKQIEKSGQTLEKVKADIRSSLQAQQWLDAQVKGKAEVTEADAQKFYNHNQDQFQKPEQVRASHILIRVPEEAKPEEVIEKEKAAKAAEARAKKGEDFSKLASELSEDPSAKENAGDLNFFAKEQMVPEFSEAAFGMKKGDISAPVRSQFGYHVIKVTDRKGAEKVSFEQAKAQLLPFLQQQGKQEEIQKVIKDVRAKADVKINLPQPPPAPAAPALGGSAPAEAAPAEPAATAPASPKKK